MIDTNTFQRKTFRIQAIRITAENMTEVGAWCKGSIFTESRPFDDENTRVLVVSTSRVNGQVQKIKAFVGDWVSCLTRSNHFKVYQHKAFVEAFEPILSTAERREAVLDLLEEMTEHTGNTLTDVKNYTKTIMELFEGAA